MAPFTSNLLLTVMGGTWQFLRTFELVPGVSFLDKIC